MMRKRMKKGSAFVIALALVLSVFALTETYAAPQIAQTADYSMTLHLPTHTPDELNTANVTADIYKVASVGIGGKYTVETAFHSLSGAFAALSVTDNAAQWEAILTDAAALIEAGGITPVQNDAAFTEKQLAVDNLMPGVYLVNTARLVTDCYKYTFTPCLVVLPGLNTEKEWVKDVTVHLKGEKLDREGFLVINKNLLNYNTTNDSGVFVFEVNAAADGVTVYNEVAAIDFWNLNAAPDSDWVKVGPIKAGAAATVTEVYSGAGYKETDKDPEEPVTILADPALDWVTEEERPATIAQRLAVKDTAVDVEVTFENTHKDVPNGGTGIVNTFKAGETAWELERDDQGQDTRPQQ